MWMMYLASRDCYSETKTNRIICVIYSWYVELYYDDVIINN